MSVHSSSPVHSHSLSLSCLCCGKTYSTPLHSAKLLLWAPHHPLLASGTSDSSRLKKSRKSLTLEQKLYDTGEETSVIVRTTVLTESTHRTVPQNASKICACVETGSSRSAQISNSEEEGKRYEINIYTNADGRL